MADFSERGVYASYLIGELRVDALDIDQEEDAATSSRQKIVEDNPRYLALKQYLIDELKHIQSQWSKLRLDAGVKVAQEIPAVKRWLDGLPKNYSQKARKWLGRIYRVNVDDINERRQLIKHAILAFEFYKWNENIDRLNEITDENLDTVISMFQELDVLEATLYGQIVQQRMTVIRTLQEKVDQKARERAIQEYIFDHLWLLDPSWERVEASEVMEIRVDNCSRKWMPAYLKKRTRPHRHPVSQDCRTASRRRVEKRTDQSVSTTWRSRLKISKRFPKDSERDETPHMNLSSSFAYWASLRSSIPMREESKPSKTFLRHRMPGMSTTTSFSRTPPTPTVTIRRKKRSWIVWTKLSRL